MKFIGGHEQIPYLGEGFITVLSKLDLEAVLMKESELQSVSKLVIVGA